MRVAEKACGGQGGKGTETQETCTTYNILKLARYLFTWTGDSRFFDFYERAMMNGIMGTQRFPTQVLPPQ